MIKGAFFAFGIMIVLVPIPIVHIVGIPFGAFIGAYFGITLAQGGSRSPASKSIIFGALLGLLAFLTSATVVAILTAITGWNAWFLWGFVAVFSLYTWSMGALGAMYSQLNRATPRAT